MNAVINNSHRKDSVRYWILARGFWEYFFATRKYVELYKTKTGVLAIVFSLFASIIICHSLDFDIDGHLAQTFQGAIINIISGLLGLLGFVVGGLALTSGTIDTNTITIIVRNGKISNLMGLLYSFCFHGSMVIFSILLLSFTFLVSTLPYSEIDKFIANRTVLFTLSMIIVYFCTFSVLYSLTILMTCLRLFLLRYQNSIMRQPFRRK